MNAKKDALSLKLSNFLFHNVFFLYNFLYPLFKYKKDASEIRLLKKYIKPGDCIIDIGANIGFYSKILSSLTGPNGRVYSFEPDKKNYARLTSNIKNYKNIVPQNEAVAESTRIIKLYQSKLLNVDHRTYKVDGYTEETDIEATSLDDFVAGKFKVDLIKMDIQGFELSALKGMKQTLKNNPGIKILTEMWPHGLKKANNSCTELIQFVEEQGFNAYELREGQLTLFDKKNLESIEQYPFEKEIDLVIAKEITI